MINFLAEYYDWLKALHVIAVISWMAGMLYLPRIFVYHTTVSKGSEASEIFKVMERKLLRYIMTPSMIATWIFGLALAIVSDAFQPGNGWFHAKFTLVFLLSGVHGAYAKYTRLFANDANEKSEKFFRIINEVPAVMMILIVILVIVRPI